MPKSKRLPRFKRTELTTGTSITERDLAILRTIENHRFLRSSQIAQLVGGSRQQVLRRLQRLYHLGRLERPRSQIDYYHEGGGSRELIYAAPGQNVQRFYLEHALMISDIAVAFERACADPRFAQLELIQKNQFADECRQNTDGDDPLQWHVNVTRQLRIGVRPDRILQVGLRFSVFPAAERATFFVEADRSTMPIYRSSLEQTSIFRKLLAYHSTWAQGVHRSLFKIDRFRVLIVTSDHTRIANMIEACQNIERGHRMFLFAEAKEFANAENIFDLPLINGKGEPDSLLNAVDLRTG